MKKLEPDSTYKKALGQKYGSNRGVNQKMTLTT